jgi:CRISPR-associated exonuclease Cas4
MYNEEDYLLLSGIQHFAFCRRQWALIYIEQQWEENLRTIDGRIMHERAHDGCSSEKRGGIIVTRSMPVISATFGVRGVCDVVEFHEDPDGVKLHGRRGRYKPIPVEYKKGRPKMHDADVLQLCAQAICLEEMLVCEIEKGYLYYGETRRREEVEFLPELRNKVYLMLEEMRELFRRRHTPKVKTGAHCRACSLQNVCLPKLCGTRTASSYIKSMLEEG